MRGKSIQILFISISKRESKIFLQSRCFPVVGTKETCFTPPCSFICCSVLYLFQSDISLPNITIFSNSLPPVLYCFEANQKDQNPISPSCFCPSRIHFLKD
mmetsp:Transcript_14953/g.16592  ORF Transcript_14953/g.16592 Transcript_14953/m.16592 type:complete len:101 (-) Transcript_14953:89-391(-)